MRRLPLLVILCLPLISCHEGEQETAASLGVQDPTGEYPLTAWCAACHNKEYEAWKDSDHARAWRKLSAQEDAAPFNGQILRLQGADMRFFRTPEGVPMIHDSGTGKEYEVTSAIGNTPFVQYLVRGERGLFQCPSVAWDIKRGEWFDTVSEDARLIREGLTERRQGDWGHWLGRGMTWNSQCAWCHMSGFEKQYDATKDAYNSRWLEPGVSCIQCHSLADKMTLPNGRPVRRNKDKKLTAKQIADSCASCHARREELRPGFREGDLFDDYFRLELPLVEGVFWPNGMQRDETYTETGMRLSPMGRAGVTCLDCHSAHSSRLKRPQEDNSLCLHCHGSGRVINGTPAPVIDMDTHTPCPPESKGGRCVECHMPESRYMARDARRDHAFTSPDPALSSELGIPNACIMCHTDKDNAWAQTAVEATYGSTPEMAKYRPRTRAIAAAMKGEGNTEELLAAYRAETHPAWQATLMELLARQEPCEAIREEARKAATATDPLLRAAAASVLGEEAPQLLQDPVRVVRHAAARAQAESLLSQDTPPPALIELEETLRHQADHPAGQIQMAALDEMRASLARRKGLEEEATPYESSAEQHFRRAVELDPASAAARMDFAVHLARRDRPVDALEQMLACAAMHPDLAEVQYRLALILYELGHAKPAILALEKALRLSPNHDRARHALNELRSAHPSPTP